MKDGLVVDFSPREGDPKAKFELNYDFKLASFEVSSINLDQAVGLLTCWTTQAAKKHGMKGSTEMAT